MVVYSRHYSARENRYSERIDSQTKEPVPESRLCLMICGWKRRTSSERNEGRRPLFRGTGFLSVYLLPHAHLRRTEKKQHGPAWLRSILTTPAYNMRLLQCPRHWILPKTVP